MSKMIKKITVFIFLAVLVAGCNNMKTYDEITYDEYKQMMDNKESFILFIGSNQCSHCTNYKKTLNNVIKKYGVDVKYIDIASLSDSDLSAFKSHVSFSGTPTTIFISKGKEKSHYNRIVGDQDYSTVVEKFKKNGYIKEK